MKKRRGVQDNVPRVPLGGWKAVPVDPQTMGDCCFEGACCGIEMMDARNCSNLGDYGNLGIDIDTNALPFLKRKSKNKRKKKQKVEKKIISKGKQKKMTKAQTPKQELKKEESNSEEEMDVEEASESWKGLDLDPSLLSAIRKCGFAFPLPIQSYCIPAAVKRRKDVLGAAQTGSGKTLAFGIPIFQCILEENQRSMQPTLTMETLPSSHIHDEEMDEGEEMVEIEESDEDKGMEELIQVEDGVSRVYDDPEELAITNNEIAKLDQELGVVSYSDLYRKGNPETSLKALVLTPTRELALQVAKQLQAIGKEAKIRVVPLVGGMAPQKQTRLLSYNPEVVIATPGRFLDLYQKGIPHLRDLSQLRFFVIDECDKMIRHGDFKDLTILLQYIPEYQIAEETYDAKHDKGKKQRKKKKDELKYKVAADNRKMQTLLFSATLTLPRSLHRKLRPKDKKQEQEGEDVDEMALALDHLRFRGEPYVVDLTSKAKLAEKIQEAYILTPEDKIDAYLYSIILKYPGRTLVFCNAIKSVRKLTECLRLLGILAQPIHAAKQQSQRLKALDRFKCQTNSVLVATDVAARGLDIPDVRCVVHYNVPRAADLYIHRSGRTARVEADGLALSLVMPSELLRFQALFRALGRQKPPEFPLDPSPLPECALRYQLAKHVADLDAKLLFRKKDEAWNKDTAETLGLPIEDGSESDDREEMDKEMKELKEKRDELFLQLQRRLGESVGGKMSRKYFTGKELPQNAKEAVRANVDKARKLSENKPVVKSGSDRGKQLDERARVARHQTKMAELLDEKLDKKGKMKSLSYAKQKLVVIPPALGREAQGPDALTVMRQHLQKRSSSKI